MRNVSRVLRKWSTAEAPSIVGRAFSWEHKMFLLERNARRTKAKEAAAKPFLASVHGLAGKGVLLAL